ncbi:cyclopropane-fatty-acyl-phospholipid synthase [Rhodococcoides trifolii]|uniref:Cyclopropane-fatty-acyl-phospholipid synthase n=1 Tax=Rhodococcoides trifolii TaxID=908250 RepID=A0A917G8J8_9NOCA|nr:cyclopropane mycolic acid synthase family methyltransferase [Rhodococcus trifolii]GGG28095.1 cyclopropane-fatty-acyl-phospholipid synthase [Rhodococcus trifolii]
MTSLEPNSQLQPNFSGVQAHYDASDEFFALFLDPTLTYSCAYFERDDMTLEEAQIAKIDLALGKLNLKPGQRLLDIGCGWGSVARRAVENYDVDVVGLTLSRNQFESAGRMLATLDTPRTAEVRLQGWEEFDEPVDAIVSIGAFEHFKRHRYPAFFERCQKLLPPDGRMLLHTIVIQDLDVVEKYGIEFGRADMDFVRFMMREIFPGGQLAYKSIVATKAEASGFTIERQQALGPHYARTLDTWAATLDARRDEAIAVGSQELYDKYAHYLAGCADRFRDGRIDVVQYTLLPGHGT